MSAYIFWSWILLSEGGRVRCIAKNKDLDAEPNQPRRSKAHTEALVQGIELGKLWDDYGIVGDVVVSV